MTKDEIIANQKEIIDKYEKMLMENEKVYKELFNSFFTNDQPLNRNYLKFNKDQLKWIYDVYILTNHIKYLSK